MMPTIDLNADLGEGGSHDAGMIRLVSSANIACGGHAGDAETIRRTIRLACAAGVAVGAHPGYEDRANFGRAALSIAGADLLEMIVRQLSLFRRIADDAGVDVHHVKPHGALYHQAARDSAVASAFAAAVATVFPGTMVYCPPSGEMRAACLKASLVEVPEGFADRRYAENGTLVPRSAPDAVLSIPDEAAAQALRIVSSRSVITRTGRSIPLSVRTLCVHGDAADAPVLLRAVRKAMAEASVIIAAP
jgi:5-oxoprolinase (ATP-hydrolysing) subunit A